MKEVLQNFHFYSARALKRLLSLNLKWSRIYIAIFNQVEEVAVDASEVGPSL